MLAWVALAGGLLGGLWWVRRGARRARRLYRRWRWCNSIEVYGFGEPGRAWQIDAVVAATLALAGPFVPADVDAGRAHRAVYFLLAIVCLVFGGVAR